MPNVISNNGSAVTSGASTAEAPSPLPWSAPLSFLGDEDIAMLQKLGKKIPRGLLNDGGMMIRDANGLGIAIVMCQSKFKRGEGHHAICEARDEIAALICRAVNSHDALFAYAECEEARACSEDVAETVLKQHGWKPTECTSHDFMDRMRRATLAKVKE